VSQHPKTRMYDGQGHCERMQNPDARFRCPRQSTRHSPSDVLRFLRFCDCLVTAARSHAAGEQESQFITQRVMATKSTRHSPSDVLRFLRFCDYLVTAARSHAAGEQESQFITQRVMATKVPVTRRVTYCGSCDSVSKSDDKCQR
jgi:hypothetical protein